MCSDHQCGLDKYLSYVHMTYMYRSAIYDTTGDTPTVLSMLVRQVKDIMYELPSDMKPSKVHVVNFATEHTGMSVLCKQD